MYCIGSNTTVLLIKLAHVFLIITLLSLGCAYTFSRSNQHVAGTVQEYTRLFSCQLLSEESVSWQTVTYKIWVVSIFVVHVLTLHKEYLQLTLRLNAPFIRSVEQKATMVHLLRQSIQEQQRLYGSPSGMATPISTHSFVTSRSLPSLTVPQSNLPHQSSSPSLLHQLHRVTSPTPSSFSTATGR